MPATNWLGRQDSNLRMPGSKPGALPLGDAPSLIATGIVPGAMKSRILSRPAQFVSIQVVVCQATPGESKTIYRAAVPPQVSIINLTVYGSRLAYTLRGSGGLRSEYQSR